MQASGVPPLHSRKGIKVMQTHPHLPINTPKQSKMSEVKEFQQFPSETGSIRSSRNRGISMSRESGINLDRIYDAKHFLPKTSTNLPSSSSKGESRTIISCKSMQLLSDKSNSESKNNLEEAPLRIGSVQNEGESKYLK